MTVLQSEAADFPEPGWSHSPVIVMIGASFGTLSAGNPKSWSPAGGAADLGVSWPCTDGGAVFPICPHAIDTISKHINPQRAIQKFLAHRAGMRISGGSINSEGRIHRRQTAASVRVGPSRAFWIRRR